VKLGWRNRPLTEDELNPLHPPDLRVYLRTPKTKRARRAGPEILSARLVPHVALEAHANGEVVTRFQGHSFSLGKFSDRTADRAQELRSGLPFSSSAASMDKELYLLIRRLAGHGLIEYGLGPRNGEALVVIEPQVSDYWPRIITMRDTDALVLSRFAYMRRRGNEIVLESPRAGALFKICNPKIATALARFSSPQQIRRLRDHFPGIKFLALLVDCEILIKLKSASDSGLRPTEGDDNLVLWDFHDLLFHARSTEGRHANPLGGVYPTREHFFTTGGPAAVAGKRIPLCKFSTVSRRQSRSEDFCVNVIRRATSMINDQSRSRNCRVFSTARASPVRSK
jgi:hypothetical protein